MFTELIPSNQSWVHLALALQWVQTLEEVHVRHSWLHVLHTFASVGETQFTTGQRVRAQTGTAHSWVLPWSR